MVDFLGKDINVGDRVVYVNRRRFASGVVRRMNENYIYVKPDVGRNLFDNSQQAAPYNVIVLPK